MSPALIAVLVVVGLIALFGLGLIGMYNGLVRLRMEAKNAWAQIDVQLKRRHDLIPNLVETVKGYAGHEKSTLEAVVQARNQAVKATDLNSRIAAEGQLSQTLGRLMMLVESYPQLKANENFSRLQEELASTENKVGFARQYYNDSVMGYNTRIQTFPSNILAGMFNFEPSPFFKVEDEAERAAPQVKF